MNSLYSRSPIFENLYSRRGIQNVLEKYRGDIDNLSCHSLRHTFCKNLVDAGVSLEKVAAFVGH